MKIYTLFLQRSFFSQGDGTALTTTLQVPIDVLGAKSLTVNLVIHSVNSADTRVSFPYQPGADGKNWEAIAGVLYDSSTAVSAGAASPASATDVTRWPLVLPAVKVEKSGGGASSQKAVTMSAWALVKPF